MIEIRTELFRDKSMPASGCVVQACNNGPNPREGISLHNSPPSSSVYQGGRDSCPHIPRTSTQPAVLLFAPSMSLMTVLPGLIMWERP